MTKIVYALVALLIAGSFQTTTPANEFSPELMLKPRAAVRLLIPANQQAGPSFEMIGERAGINVVFVRDFKPETPMPLRIENATLVEALNQLSAQTGNFWFPWSARTIVVAPDSQVNRRDLEPLLTKTIYLDSDWNSENVNAITSRLRDRYQLRGIFPNQDARALVARDTANRVALAEQEIALISNATAPRRTSAALSYPNTTTDYVSISENGRIRRLVPSTRAHLEGVLKESVTIDRSDTPQAIYEDLALRAGLNVIFDNRMKVRVPQRLRLDKVDLLDALDLLALQSASFWRPVDRTTIFISDDTQQNRRDQESTIVKAIYFTDHAADGAFRNPQDAASRRNAILNVLRTAFTLRGVFVSAKSNAILIKDTPIRVFVAEKFIADLDQGSLRPASVTLNVATSSYLTENGWLLGAALEARPKLDLRLRGNTNIALTATPRDAFAALADMAGLKVEFDPGVASSPAAPLRLNGVDILDALDMLSMQTRHFWQVVDEHTIRVLPDTQAMRMQREPRETRTFVPADSSEDALAEMLNVLRVVFSLRETKIENNSIVVRDTLENLALVQSAIDILGKPAVRN